MYKIKDSPAKRKLSWKKVKSKMMDDAMTLSRTHTHTNSHSHWLTHAYMTPQSTGRWMKWLSDILCCPAKGLLKFSRGEVCRIPATDSDCQLPVWRRALKTFPYLAGGTWQARLPCGNIRCCLGRVKAQVAKVEHNFYHRIYHINNSVNIFNKPQIKTTKH